MTVGQEYLRLKLPAKLGWLNIRATYFFRAKLQVTIHPWRSLCWIVPQLISVLNNRDLYQLCPWSHIQLIVYLDNIISIALIPVLKYWWRRANNTAASQVVIKGVLLHFSNTSSVIRNNVHHYEIPNALAMKIQQSCNEKRFLRVKYLWNLFCGGAGGNSKSLWYPLLWRWRYHSLTSCYSMQLGFYMVLHLNVCDFSRYIDLFKWTVW